jgi:hypothetical protein
MKSIVLRLATAVLGTAAYIVIGLVLEGLS